MVDQAARDVVVKLRKGSAVRLRNATRRYTDDAGRLKLGGEGGKTGILPPVFGGTGHDQGAEPPLGNPASDGQTLHSLTDGTRYWADGGTSADDLAPRTAHDPTRETGDLIYRDPAAVTTVAIGFIGDSITLDAPSGGSSPPAHVATDLTGHGLTVAATNAAVSGSTSGDWQPGDPSDYLADALADFASGGVRLVHVMLGTNDSATGTATSAATYRANLLAIAGELIANGYLVMLSVPPYANLAGFSNSLLLAYQAEIRAICNGVTTFLGDTSAYEYFQANPGEQYDGLHPNAAGAAALGGLWADRLVPLARSVAYEQALARLPIGDEGDVLTVAAGVPAWAAPRTPETYGIVFTGGGDVALRGDGTIATKVY